MTIPVTAIDGGVYDGVSSHTKSTTCPTGDNRVLYVALYMHASSAVSSVEWNSTALTQLGEYNNSTKRVFLYRLISPDEGSHDLDITFGIGSYGGASLYFCEDVDQTNPEDVAVVGSFGSAGSASDNITPTNDDCLLLNAVAVEATFASNPTPDGSQTEVNQVDVGGLVVGGSSYLQLSGGGGAAQSMGYTWTSSFNNDDFAHIVAAVRPIAGTDATDERDAGVHGQDTANSDRSAEVTGVKAASLTATQDAAQINLEWTY